MIQVQYISDENGQKTGVIVPIDLWRELQSEKETAYLLKSETMRNRLIEARQGSEDIDFGEACEWGHVNGVRLDYWVFVWLNKF